ncbi:Alpha/beta hydrolase family protein [compost metagenome]|jgi:pimeloyl-ACP methyl ester carboxylesterase
MQWYGGGDFSQRYDAVVAAIDKAQLRGDRVVVVGESAGASMAINVVAHRPDVDGLVTVCGITNSQAEVSPLIRKKSPAFNEAISRLDSSLNMLNLTRVCSVRAVIDSVVPKHSSVITGARQGVAWSVGHLFTITLCLSLYGGYVVYLIRTFKKAHSA